VHVQGRPTIHSHSRGLLPLDSKGASTCQLWDFALGSHLQTTATTYLVIKLAAQKRIELYLAALQALR
jgi:hypothetical protein